ncbi:MAG: ABC transporter permease [Candidatus Competibacterales bacterium]
MLRYLVLRLGHSLVALWGVVTLVFIILQLSGDPTLLLVPDGATQADIDALRQALGFDRPLIVQYGDYLWHLLHFDLGISVVQQVPVAEIIAPRIPYTLALAAGGFLVAAAVGFPAGIVLGVYRDSLGARLLMPLVLVGQSLPTFWSGLLLILLFAVTLNWLPASGAESGTALILPAVALGALSMATFARITRTAILEELGKEYVRAALAKGLPFHQVVRRHVLRNAALPIITIVALELANLLTGAVVVETVFAWPGIGLLAIQAISSRDFLLVQAIVLLGAVVYIALNLIADLLYSLADPRIRLGYSRGAGR